MGSPAVEIARARALIASGEGQAIRERAGLSRAEVASAIPASETAVWRWETGKRTPRGEMARRYARVLRQLSKAVRAGQVVGFLFMLLMVMLVELVPLKKVPEHRRWTSERLLRRLVAERRIPYYKATEGHNGRVLIDLRDLDAYVEASRVEAVP